MIYFVQLKSDAAFRSSFTSNKSAMADHCTKVPLCVTILQKSSIKQYVSSQTVNSPDMRKARLLHFC